MPPTCSICTSGPKLATIDALVLAGKVSLRKIAEAHGVSYQSLRDHRNNGHVAPGSPRARQDGRGTPGGDGRVNASVGEPDDATGDPGASGDSSALDHMRQVIAKLGAVDVSALSPNQATQHIESYRRAAETLSRLEPPSTPDVVRIEDVDGLVPFLADMMETLDAFPAARSAVADILGRHRLAIAGGEPRETTERDWLDSVQLRADSLRRDLEDHGRDGSGALAVYDAAWREIRALAGPTLHLKLRNAGSHLEVEA